MKKIFTLTLTFLLIISSIGCAFAAKESKEKITFDKKLLKSVELVESDSRDTPMMLVREADKDVTILGEPVTTEAQMVKYIKAKNPKPKLNCTVEEIVDYYYEEGLREGVRPDVALCQAMKETGIWNYGGDVSPKQNNFCGLGATGNKEPGASFPTPQIGVRAHIQHLLCYTSTEPPKTEIVDPRYEFVKKFRKDVFGKITTWTGLNGVWAVPGNQYGEDILMRWRQSQDPDDSDESLDFANIQLEKSDDKAAAYVYRGLVYFARKNFVDAQKDFQSALKLEPKNANVLFNLAITQEKNGKVKDALKTYDEYLKVEPKSDAGYYNRGKLKLSQKKYKDAIKDFQSTLDIEDRFVDALNETAVAYFRQKKYEEALDTLRFAAEVNTTNETIQANLEKLESCVKKK